MKESRAITKSINICSNCNRNIGKCSNLNCSKTLTFNDIIFCDFRKHYCYDCGK